MFCDQWNGEGAALPGSCQTKILENLKCSLLSKICARIQIVRGTKQFRQVKPTGRPKRRYPISLQLDFQPGRVTDAALPDKVIRQKQYD